jgi:hypothetical protein
MTRFLAYKGNIRMISKTFLGLLFATLISVAPLLAAGVGNSELSVVLSNSISKLDRETSVDMEGPMVLVDLLEKEFGTREEEFKWGMDHRLSWGEIAALAYIQATTGKSFSEMNQEDARRNFWAYAENAGMSREKMARWLEGFQKRAERERNSRIFDRLRASRKVHALPDLGSGFGLLQEALDFRRIESPRPTKVHELPGELAKGEK